MRIKEFMKTFAIAALTIGSVFAFSHTTEAAATVSIEKAAQKIYKAETKAYNTKKDVSVTVKVAAPSNTKKAIKKVTGELENVLIKEELGDVDFTYVIRDTYVKASIGSFISYLGTYNCHAFGTTPDIFYHPNNAAAFQTATYKSGVLTVKLDIKGSKKWYRDQYKENTYLAKCLEELREQTEGMSEKDKAWTIAIWADEHFIYDGNYSDGKETKYSLLWKGQSRGVCEQQARTYQLLGCLMGINVGYVSTGENHGLNCVKIDGEIYYVDLPDVDSFTKDWEAFVKGQSNASKISSIDNFKEWVDGTPVGEWCLLTADEYLQCVSGYENTSKWKIFWKIGGRF